MWKILLYRPISSLVTMTRCTDVIVARLARMINILQNTAKFKIILLLERGFTGSRLSVCPSVCWSVCSFGLSASLSVRSSVRPFVLSVCLHGWLSVCVSVREHNPITSICNTSPIVDKLCRDIPWIKIPAEFVRGRVARCMRAYRTNQLFWPAKPIATLTGVILVCDCFTR